MSKFATSKKEFEAILKEADGDPIAVVPIPVGSWQEHSYGATGTDRMVHRAEVVEYPVEWRERIRYGPDAGKFVRGGVVHKDGVRVRVNFRQFGDDPDDVEEMVIQRKWVRGTWAPEQKRIDEWQKDHDRRQAASLYYIKLAEAAGMMYEGEDYPPTAFKYQRPERDYEAEQEHRFSCDLQTLCAILEGIKDFDFILMPFEKWMKAYDKSGSTPSSPIMF